MEKLTPRQKEVINYIITYTKENSFSPSVRDIAEHFAFSVKAAHDHLKALESKKAIRTTRGISRSIELLGSYSICDNIRVPVIEQVDPDIPLLSSEQVKETIPIPRALLKGRFSECFAFCVTGDSLIGDGIQKGDFAVFTTTDSAEEGEIVLATIGILPEIHMMHYHPQKTCVELRPSNRMMSTIVTEHLNLHGKLKLLIRSFR